MNPFQRHSLFALRLMFAVGVIMASSGISAESLSVEAPGKTVLVTGASSGSGRAIAESLAAGGHHVFAGARKQEDLEALEAIENIEAVRLDVTIQSEIDAAVKKVEQSGRPLHAIINNAGVGLQSPLIELDEEDLDFLFDVNVYGPYRITKAFAPLLIASKGRVVNIGSIAGVQTRSFYGPYSMSKHALEAYTDALSIELERFGVQVSIVDPGGFRSNIGKNTYARLKARGLNFEDSLYREDWESNWILQGGDLSMIKGPDDIVVAVEHALFNDRPQDRYMVVGDSGRAENTMRALIHRMLELNQNQPFSYDRDGLIQLLDDEMARLGE